MKKRMQTGRRRLLIVPLISLLLTATGGPSYSNGYDVRNAAPAGSPPSGAWADEDSVWFSISEADSLIDMFDDQLLELRLLRIDLREAQQMAYVDSTLAADRLALYKEQRPTWIMRIVAHPALWFIVGAYVGLRLVPAIPGP